MDWSKLLPLIAGPQPVYPIPPTKPLPPGFDQMVVPHPQYGYGLPPDRNTFDPSQLMSLLNYYRQYGQERT